MNRDIIKMASGGINYVRIDSKNEHQETCYLGLFSKSLLLVLQILNHFLHFIAVVSSILLNTLTGGLLEQYTLSFC